MSINITVTIPDIIHHFVFYLKHVLEIEFCLHFQVEPTPFGPIDRASLRLHTPAITTIRFIKSTKHRPTTKINIFHTLNLHTNGAQPLYTWTVSWITLLKTKTLSKPHSVVDGVWRQFCHILILRIGQQTLDNATLIHYLPFIQIGGKNEKALSN
jgi:hypothetical protein